MHRGERGAVAATSLCEPRWKLPLRLLTLPQNYEPFSSASCPIDWKEYLAALIAVVKESTCRIFLNLSDIRIGLSDGYLIAVGWERDLGSFWMGCGIPY